jgi:hypothetical protein
MQPNVLRAQIWDTIDSIPIPTQIIRHGPFRTELQINQCYCDLQHLKSHASEYVIGTDKIVSRNLTPQFFNETTYPTDTIFQVTPNPTC